jgi:hypothetical protein
MLEVMVVNDFEQLREIGEALDEDKEQWDRLRRLIPLSPARKLCLPDLCQAYEEATGTRTGCD